MALALKNPRDTSRVKKIARILTKKAANTRNPAQTVDMHAEALVGQWLNWAKKGGPKPAVFRRSVNKDLKKMSKAQRKKFYAGLPESDRGLNRYAQTAVVMAFEQLGGPAYGAKVTSRRKGAKPRKYSTRFMAGKQTRYIGHRDKKTGRYVTAGNRKAGKRRAAIRKSSADFDSSTRTWGKPGARGKVSGQILAGKRKAAANPRRKISAYNRFVGNQMKKGNTMKQAARMWRAKKNGLALTNYGGLALENRIPFVGSAVGSLKNLDKRVSKALPVGAGALIAVGAGAAAHMLLVPMAMDRASTIPVLDKAIAAPGYVWDKVTSVPVVGQYIGFAPNTAIGLLVGAGLAALAGVVYTKAKQPMIAGGLAALAGGVALSGPVMDVGSYLGGEGDMDDLAALDDVDFDDLSGLALENLGGLALENYGDGMAYQLAGLGQGSGDEYSGISSEDEYGQTTLADAYYSGADFDLGEGRALLKGRGSWRKRFGKPSHRMTRTGSGASHMAGQPGHRWGWLIKMVGWENARKLAALEPQQRLVILKELRGNAIETFNQMHAAASSSEAPIVSGETADGAMGAMGASSTFGSTIFAGQGL